MEIDRSDIRHSRERHRFELALEKGEAYVEYERREGVIDLLSTWVPPAHRNRGIGEAIVVRALEFARDRGLEVIPTCPFVPRVIDRNPEFRSLTRSGPS
ncbi:MAG: GNAT family N-acetyltransferase [Gemmatimonadota bacterium]|nr:GNAT family N-acetyltransferase [Gemmatimonadota bacterium]